MTAYQAPSAVRDVVGLRSRRLIDAAALSGAEEVRQMLNLIGGSLEIPDVFGVSSA